MSQKFTNGKSNIAHLHIYKIINGYNESIVCAHQFIKMSLEITSFHSHTERKENINCVLQQVAISMCKQLTKKKIFFLFNASWYNIIDP